MLSKAPCQLCTKYLSESALAIVIVYTSFVPSLVYVVLIIIRYSIVYIV